MSALAMPIPSRTASAVGAAQELFSFLTNGNLTMEAVLAGIVACVTVMSLAFLIVRLKKAWSVWRNVRHGKSLLSGMKSKFINTNSKRS